MSAYNPHKKNMHRSPYELPDLVKQFGQPFYHAPLTEEQLQVADAIQSHTFIIRDRISGGLAAVGEMMSLVAAADLDLERDHLAGLGHLIKHLAVEIEYLQDVESNIQVHIEQSALAAAKAALAPVPVAAPPHVARPSRKPRGGASA